MPCAVHWLPPKCPPQPELGQAEAQSLKIRIRQDSDRDASAGATQWAQSHARLAGGHSTWRLNSSAKYPPRQSVVFSDFRGALLPMKRKKNKAEVFPAMNKVLALPACLPFPLGFHGFCQFPGLPLRCPPQHCTLWPWLQLSHLSDYLQLLSGFINPHVMHFSLVMWDMLTLWEDVPTSLCNGVTCTDASQLLMQLETETLELKDTVMN